MFCSLCHCIIIIITHISHFSGDMKFSKVLVQLKPKFCFCFIYHYVWFSYKGLTASEIVNSSLPAYILLQIEVEKNLFIMSGVCVICGTVYTYMSIEVYMIRRDMSIEVCVILYTRSLRGPPGPDF